MQAVMPSALYVPGKQSLHAVPVPARNFPAAHAPHSFTDVSPIPVEYVPLGQSWHTLAPSPEYEPVEQFSHPDPPTPEANMPATHVQHPVEPASGANVPDPHPRHEDPLPAERYGPGSHSAQEPVIPVLENVPAAQSRHVEDACSPA